MAKLVLKLKGDELDAFGRNYGLLLQRERSGHPTLVLNVDGKDTEYQMPEMPAEDKDKEKEAERQNPKPGEARRFELLDLMGNIRLHERIHTPVLVDEQGYILRGVGRYVASRAVGVDCPHQIIPIKELAQKWGMKPEDEDHARHARHTFIRANRLSARVLTEGQRMEMVRAEIREDYERGDKQGGKHSSHLSIATRLGVSSTTVAKLRTEMIHENRGGKYANGIKETWTANGKPMPLRQPILPITPEATEKAKKEAKEKKAEKERQAKEAEAEQVREYLKKPEGKKLAEEALAPKGRVKAIFGNGEPSGGDGEDEGDDGDPDTRDPELARLEQRCVEFFEAIAKAAKEGTVKEVKEQSHPVPKKGRKVSVSLHPGEVLILRGEAIKQDKKSA